MFRGPCALAKGGFGVRRSTTKPSPNQQAKAVIQKPQAGYCMWARFAASLETLFGPGRKINPHPNQQNELLITSRSVDGQQAELLHNNYVFLKSRKQRMQEV